MKKYTANYTYTNHNFVIQNLNTKTTNLELLPTLYVLKNILQRGTPTIASKYLQSQFGKIHQHSNFEERFLFSSAQAPVWKNTIKGDAVRNYYPAKDFLERIIPNAFGEYAFVQSLIIPEIPINEIIPNGNNEFIGQQVDFYLPQAKLVIEIDGQQHKLDQVTRISDSKRDDYLSKNGIKTIRITTEALKNGSYIANVEQIINHLQGYKKLLEYYRNSYEKVKSGAITSEEVKTKLLPTAVMRFQILVVELLVHNYLSLDKDWYFTIRSHEALGNFPELAIQDTLLWIEQLWKLRTKQDFKRPKVYINLVSEEEHLRSDSKAIIVDFSLFKRYTDEHNLNKKVLYVRTDYFDNPKEYNYFQVSTTTPINYKITEDDKPVLEFFLQNIFGKNNFREGQFPIIANVLNREDTIGLLPTGGGKSLCYQLPCLLQPAISFVVCPIKSLMYDQYDNLKKIHITNASFITSDLEQEERRLAEAKFEQAKYLFIWISPEKFQIPSFRDKISALLANHYIAYAVVDEVHCLSEWGHDFRTSYLNLAKTIDKLSPKDETGEGVIKFIGLTATASVNVLKDIKIEFSRQKQQLKEENIKSLLDYSRKELQFEVINDKGNKFKILKDLLDAKIAEGELLGDVPKAALIFTPYVNGNYGCYNLANNLNIHYPDKVRWFSGQLPSQLRITMDDEAFKRLKNDTQDGFKSDKFPILTATKAFGMGIDKQNIYFTFHYGIPSSVEALYQEAGRAGRWDKNLKENRGKVGQCYILYSPETYNPKELAVLFQKDTTIDQISDILKTTGNNKQDVFRQVFLFLQGQRDIENDFKLVTDIINRYYKENEHVLIQWKDAEEVIGINKDVLQKIIYRLSLLGIVNDWTTDFSTHYAVDFNTIEEGHIIKSLSSYIKKYDASCDVQEEINRVKKDTVLEKSVWYLLNWIFDNIVYSRKQSLKTLSDWCSEFQNSEQFKKRIDNYFIFSDTTFILQHIAEHPLEYEKWFDVLKGCNEQSDILKLKDSLSRFLESYRNNIGLNLISGLIRLKLNAYTDSDGKDRFENALSDITKKLSSSQQAIIASKIIVIGRALTEVQRIQLYTSLVTYFPDQTEELAEKLHLAYLLVDKYQQKLNRMRLIKKKLYEQLAEI